MKNIGIVRKIDSVGRVVIPKITLRQFNLGVGDLIAIYTDGDMVIYKKYEFNCTICGNNEDTIMFKHKKICKECKDDLSAIAKSNNW